MTETEHYNSSYLPQEYKSKLDRLEKEIALKMIKINYEEAIEAFEYWSFPYFCRYKHLLRIDNPDNYKSNLEKILHEIKTEESKLYESDSFKNSISFQNSINPLIKWSSLNYGFEINQLLNGNNTTLYADIHNSEFQAVRFNNIIMMIELKSSNSTQNKALNDLLRKNFRWFLTHSGPSYYKFEGNTFVRSNEKIKLSNIYRDDYDEKLSDANEALRKLNSYKPVLSPYTFWEIRLELHPPNPMKQKEELQKLLSTVKNADEIIVSLYINGQYLDESHQKVNDC